MIGLLITLKIDQLTMISLILIVNINKKLKL